MLVSATTVPRNRCKWSRRWVRLNQRFREENLRAFRPDSKVLSDVGAFVLSSEQGDSCNSKSMQTPNIPVPVQRYTCVSPALGTPTKALSKQHRGQVTEQVQPLRSPHVLPALD